MKKLALLVVAALVLLVVQYQAAAAATRYEAENATISQGILETSHTGFSGSAYVNNDNVSGSYTEFTINASAAGSASLVIRYANGTTSTRPSTVAVNGTTVATPTFAPTTNCDNNGGDANGSDKILKITIV